MRRLVFSLLFGSVVALAAIPATAMGAEFDTFVGCDDLSASPMPSHECQLGDFPAAYFESDEDVEYDVCLEFPDGAFVCAEEQFAEAEVLYLNSITTSEEGLHYVSWYLTGTATEVGFWAFNMRKPSPPAPPVLPAPVPVPPSVAAPAPPTTLACRIARKRVRQLQGQLRKAVTQKRKAQLRLKLRRARGSVQRACP